MLLPKVLPSSIWKKPTLRLCMILLERTEKVEPVLQEALLAFPGSSRLSLYRHAIDSFSSVPAIADPASANLETLKDRADAESSYLLGKTFHNLGLGFETRDNFEKAVRAFRLALEFDSRRTMTRERLVTLLINTGRPQEAVSVALQAVKADPTDGSALHLAAYALHKAGSVDEAISLCHQALRIGAKRASIWFAGRLLCKRRCSRPGDRRLSTRSGTER